MKKFKLPLIGLLVAGLLTIAFIGCQKDFKSPGLTSDAKGSNPPPTVFYDAHFPTSGQLCVTATSYSFNVSFTNNGGNPPGGNTSVEAWIYQGTTLLYTATTLVGTSGSIDFTGLSLDPGVYTVRVQFHHSNGPADVQNPVFEFPLTVVALDANGNCPSGGGGGDCYNGATLTQVVDAALSLAGQPVNVTVIYTVCNCGEDELYRLKLQGGLVNKASTYTSSTAGGAENLNWTPGYPKTSGGNQVLSWTFDLPAGQCENFTVAYSVWPVDCSNGLAPVTGPWSLKNAAGQAIGVAPSDQYATQPGYLDRAYYVCPQP